MYRKVYAVAYRNFDPQRPAYEDPDTALTYVKWAVWLLVCGAIMFGIALAMSGCAETNAVVDSGLRNISYHDALMYDRCRYNDDKAACDYMATANIDGATGWNTEIANENAAIMWAPGSPFNPAVIHVEP